MGMSSGLGFRIYKAIGVSLSCKKNLETYMETGLMLGFEAVLSCRSFKNFPPLPPTTLL